MIKVFNEVIKQQKSFWNNCIFHPTDAVEDAWGKRILDRMARDKAIRTVRIYAMLEDIVYEDGDGNLAFDFRLSDARLDYLTECGYDILIAYGMLPKICVESPEVQSSVANGKTRYKGKMLYTSRPTERGYEIWEMACCEFTRHIIERYGIERVSKWHLHCYNEPDVRSFFLADLPDRAIDERTREYCRLYKGFVNGILKVTDKLRIGGPSLGGSLELLDGFLKFVKKEGLRLDYIALHNYAGTHVGNIGKRGYSVKDWLDWHYERQEVIRSNGFEETELVYDEWGMAMNGFYDVAKCPKFIERDTEVFSAYYVKLIYELISRNIDISLLMICLSGQHEMVTDFSGFRNFFTLNFFAKPIYSAHVLASRLKSNILRHECDTDGVYVIPTRDEDGNYAVLLTYCDNGFSEEMPTVTKKLSIEELSEDKSVTVYCIDKDNTNPYRTYERLGKPKMTGEIIQALRKEGNLKPISADYRNGEIMLTLCANCVYLIVAE